MKKYFILLTSISLGYMQLYGATTDEIEFIKAANNADKSKFESLKDKIKDINATTPLKGIGRFFVAVEVTALEALAASPYWLRKSKEIMEMANDLLSNPKINIDRRDQPGKYSAIAFALSTYKDALARLLIDRGADVRKIDTDFEFNIPNDYPNRDDIIDLITTKKVAQQKQVTPPPSRPPSPVRSVSPGRAPSPARPVSPTRISGALENNLNQLTGSLNALNSKMKRKSGTAQEALGHF